MYMCKPEIDIRCFRPLRSSLFFGDKVSQWTQHLRWNGCAVCSWDLMPHSSHYRHRTLDPAFTWESKLMLVSKFFTLCAFSQPVTVLPVSLLKSVLGVTFSRHSVLGVCFSFVRIWSSSMRRIQFQFLNWFGCLAYFFLVTFISGPIEEEREVVGRYIWLYSVSPQWNGRKPSSLFYSETAWGWRHYLLTLLTNYCFNL